MGLPRGMVKVKGSDNAETEKAEKHLLTLLGDEHYRAALFMLNRKKVIAELLDDKGGNTPNNRGDLAKRFRGADATPQPKRNRGAQPDPELDGLRNFVKVFDSKPRPLSLAETLRKLIVHENPGAATLEVNALADKLAGQMSGIRRRSKTKA